MRHGGVRLAWYANAKNWKLPMKIIIDTDPGIDDTMAIFLALQSPELEVIGLTTIFGNVYTHQATENALRLLEIAERTDIPVAHGAENPLLGHFTSPANFVHGHDGQGNVDLPAPQQQPHEQSAAQFIVEQIMQQPDEITLVPIGPLTNIALALRLEPRIEENVKKVVLMGGNPIEPGNATPTAEANFYYDPEAADMVLGAAWPVTMIPLDATHKVHMSGEQLDQFAQADNPLSQHIGKILPFYRAFFKKTRGMDGIFIHDSTAINYLINPDWFTTYEWPLRVETCGISRGKTWPLFYPNKDEPSRTAAWDGRPTVTVAMDVDHVATIDCELERVASS